MTRPQTPDQVGASLPTRPRPRFTSRAAVLVVVVCAVALSLAYPVREYLAQLRQISELQAQQAQIVSQLRQLRAEHHALASPAYVEQQARDRLGMCFPTQTCYVIIGNARHRSPNPTSHTIITPWYERLWSSVQSADKVRAGD